eukprot:SAG31_NODE_43618_length_266_cov_0.808383_1_plen_30_part_01
MLGGRTADTTGSDPHGDTVPHRDLYRINHT